jgi:hypothetical protein
MAADQPAGPSAALVAEAKKVPGGWVYEIAAGVDPAGRVPPEYVIGAWAVNDVGELTGEYLPNPNYRASPASAAAEADRPDDDLHG